MLSNFLGLQGPFHLPSTTHLGFFVTKISQTFIATINGIKKVGRVNTDLLQSCDWLTLSIGSFLLHEILAFWKWLWLRSGKSLWIWMSPSSAPLFAGRSCLPAQVQAEKKEREKKASDQVAAWDWISSTFFFLSLFLSIPHNSHRSWSLGLSKSWPLHHIAWSSAAPPASEPCSCCWISDGLVEGLWWHNRGWCRDPGVGICRTPCPLCTTWERTALRPVPARTCTAMWHSGPWTCTEEPRRPPDGCQGNLQKST